MKRPFFLLEILIALSLISVIMSLLFSVFLKNLMIEKKMEEVRSSILERQHIQTRLQDLFTSLQTRGFPSPLYTETPPKDSSPNLFFYTDHGIDPDSRFSGIVLARLYVDNKKRLCLGLYPQEDGSRKKNRKEVLLSNVSKLRLEFFQSPPLPCLWVQAWTKGSPPPSMFKIWVDRPHESLQFVFFIPAAPCIPTYEGYNA